MHDSRGPVMKYRLAAEDDFQAGVVLEVVLSPAHVRAVKMLANGARQRVKRYLSELCANEIERALQDVARRPPAVRSERPVPRVLGELVAVKGGRDARASQ